MKKLFHLLILSTVLVPFCYAQPKNPKNIEKGGLEECRNKLKTIFKECAKNHCGCIKKILDSPTMMHHIYNYPMDFKKAFFLRIAENIDKKVCLEILKKPRVDDPNSLKNMILCADINSYLTEINKLLQK